MPKKRKSITVRIPNYAHPRKEWRRKIQSAVIEAEKKARVTYTPSDRIEVQVKLCFDGSALTKHDVDNRVKDVFDALQGRKGGSKKIRPAHPVTPTTTRFGGSRPRSIFARSKILEEKDTSSSASSGKNSFGL